MEAQVCGFDFDANYDYCDADDADDVYHVDADDVGDFDADADDADYNYCGANADDDVVESVPPLWLLSPNIGALHFVTSSLLLLRCCVPTSCFLFGDAVITFSLIVLLILPIFSFCGA